MSILAISAHPDDAELGCGGTLFQRVGVTSWCMTDCGRWPEFREACKLAGWEGIMGGFKWHEFASQRQSIADYLWSIRDQYEVVFVPMLGDIHQDHQVVTQEALRTMRNCTIYGYELPWNKCNASHVGRCIDWVNKANLLKCYVSECNRPYMHSEFIEAWAKTRGIQFGWPWAEAFDVLHGRQLWLPS